MMLSLLLACGGPPADLWVDNSGHTDDPVVEDTDEACADLSPCPCDMVPVPGGINWRFCIDRYEATVDGDFGNYDQGTNYPDGSTTATAVAVVNVKPTIHVSWYQAYAACRNSGKHLCTVDEWTDACDGVNGEGGNSYPWGETPEPTVNCAVANADGTTVWADMQPAGSLVNCTGPGGVFDLMGNVWEWVDSGITDENGVPVPGKVGGAYYAGYNNAHCGFGPHLEHTPDFEATIGVRCCADLQ